MAVMPGAGSYFFEGGETGCLLVHGFTGTPQNLRPLADFLFRRGFTVLAPRLAGHGTSVDDLERSTASDWMASVDAGLEQLRRSCTTVFAIGISFGGTLALHLAAARGEALAGVGCINSPVMDKPLADAAAFAAVTPTRGPAAWADPRALTKDPGSAAIVYAEVPKAAMQQTKQVKKLVQDELARVQIPAILFYSRDDAVVSPGNGPYLMERLGSRDKKLVELSESAHEATLDFDLERIALEWLAFVRRHGGGGASP